MARRMPAPELPLGGGTVRLDAAAARHARVLRLRPGDPIILFDGRGHEAHARLLGLDRDGLLCEAGPARARPSELPEIVLVQALPRGERLEALVRGCTEAGVGAIHFALTRRGTARPDAARALGRLDRLERIARDAARQSGRSVVPALLPPAPLVEVAARAPGEATRLVAHPAARDATRLGSEPLRPPIWLVVGPEGGWDPDELGSICKMDYIPVSLGPTVLRVQTAAVVGVALALLAARPA
ncbi:MAG: RsmE family RNA methyltransferase [Myxococcales bacterium]|nr:RsmE family RNA methyltransferase [Myxococcales bacterium]